MLSGLLVVLLRALWIWVKVGLSVLSFCQQSSMSWCRDGGQFTGAGNRNPSSIALITFNININKCKGLVNPKMKILSSITHPHVVPNPQDLRSSSTQIKMFLMKSESYRHAIDSNTTEMFPGLESSKCIGKTVHVTSVAQLQFCDATRIVFFLAKKTKIIYSTILLP